MAISRFIAKLDTIINNNGTKIIGDAQEFRESFNEGIKTLCVKNWHVDKSFENSTLLHFGGI